MAVGNQITKTKIFILLILITGLNVTPKSLFLIQVIYTLVPKSRLSSTNLAVAYSATYKKSQQGCGNIPYCTAPAQSQKSLKMDGTLYFVFTA